MHSGYADGSWYASGVLIGWTAVAVAVVFGLLAVVTWWLGVPRRLIIWSAGATPLLTPIDVPEVEAAPIKISLSGQELASPHLVTLRVESRSRRDIPSADFDAGKPLVFSLGAPVVARVRAHGNAIDALSLRKTDIRIDPVLLRRGELLHMYLLTDGPPVISCDANPLVNVAVRRENCYDGSLRLIARAAISVSLVGVGGAFAILAGKTYAHLPAWLAWLMLALLVLTLLAMGVILVPVLILPAVEQYRRGGLLPRRAASIAQAQVSRR